MPERGLKFLLLASVFTIATCGLIYELVAGTLASYLLGDSVTQFSTIIGVYLFAMGVGSWLSKFVERNLIRVFVQTELLIALLGGSSAAILFSLFAWIDSFRILLYSLILIVGTLVGLEIPLLLRILQGRLEFRDLISRVFTFDYVGALLASLLFPLVLVPHLGLVRASFLFGLLNAFVALAALWALWDQIPRANWIRNSALAVIAALGAGFVLSDRILSWSEAGVYPDPVIYARSTQYQRIVITRGRDDLRLYLNGNLQFSSRDEYRYHESLVHTGLARIAHPAHVAVLGGGDGLAVREILKYPSVEDVTLVDLDGEMPRLFTTQEMLTVLNDRAFLSPKVHVITSDAFQWLKDNRQVFDFIVADFPDPSNFSIGKLYTTTFFQRVRQSLAAGGALVVQCTSPYVARKAFWCVDATLQSAGLTTEPFHVYVPSFGEWGFILASKDALTAEPHFPAGLRYLQAQTYAESFQFPPDMDRVATEINRLNNQALVRYFEQEWAHAVH